MNLSALLPSVSSIGVPSTRFLLACFLIVLAWTTAPVELQAQLLITEIQAINDNTLDDEDRESSDWIEIFNAGDSDIDLAGYHLTDDEEELTKWTFAEGTSIASGQFLLVFASGKDRRDPAGNLHTNFRLDGEGEPLFLLTPDGGNVEAGFPPRYPPQAPDASYGLSTQSTSSILLEADAEVSYHVPASGVLGLTWVEPDFDDSSWDRGPGGIGYEPRGDFDEYVGTDVGAILEDVNSSIYIRIEFDVENAADVDLLRLLARYDDGFAVFLNGVRIPGVNDPEELTWDSRSERSQEVTQETRIDISSGRDALREGRNVLAVQAMNRSSGGNDLLFSTRLEAIAIGEVSPDTFEYFSEPTPAGPNTPGFASIAPPVEFSHEDGAYSEAQMVTLSTPLEGSEIRFTLNGVIPDEESDIYAGPIEITGASQITARVYHPDFLPGLPRSVTLILIDDSIQTVTSNLPIAIASTFGRQIPNNCEGAYTPGFFMMLEPDGEDGRTRLSSTPTFAHRVGFRRRGSSTCGRQKFSFNVEIWDAESEEIDASFFGWPLGGDYAMYGPENFDRALIRNAFIYEISRQMGQYAARTKFVECYLHTRPGPVSQASFWGLYVFMERNKIGEGRVDIDRVAPSATELPDVSGGYLLKVDRNDGVQTFSAGGLTMVPVQPKTLPPAQRSYLMQFFNEMRASLDPNTVIDRDGEFVDVASWIDHHILNFYPVNVDAFRLSGYLYKPRNGPVVMGPIWDYDRSMESTDGRDDNPRDLRGNNFFTFGWYSPLFGGQPPTLATTAWARAYRMRWRDLRESVLSDANIDGVIDGMADELDEAAERNFNRWAGFRPRRSPPPLDGSFRGEIEYLKNWLRIRRQTIDAAFTEPPLISPPGGRVESGLMVEVSVLSGADLYFTTDGSDPRGEDGEPAPSATLYTVPIVISENTRVTVRARLGNVWSDPVVETYITAIAPLVITEFSYQPAPPTLEEDPADDFSVTDMEFVEVQNVGDEPVDISAFRFRRGVTFRFEDSSISVLGPGDVLVVVNDLEAFTARYGVNDRVAGEFRGSLNDSGEGLILTGGFEEDISTADYDGDWYPEASGGGSTLVNVDPLGDNDLTLRESWRPSETPNGTPGASIPVEVEGGRRLPADTDGDGRLTIADASNLLLHLFAGASGPPLPCGDGTSADAGNVTLLDADGDQNLTLADAVRTLAFLFQRGAPHPLGTQCTRIVGCEDACN